MPTAISQASGIIGHAHTSHMCTLALALLLSWAFRKLISRFIRPACTWQITASTKLMIRVKTAKLCSTEFGAIHMVGESIEWNFLQRHGTRRVHVGICTLKSLCSSCVYSLQKGAKSTVTLCSISTVHISQQRTSRQTARAIDSVNVHIRHSMNACDVRHNV